MRNLWNWLTNLQDARLSGGELTFRLTNAWPAWLAVIATIVLVAGTIYIYYRDGGSRTAKIIGTTLRSVLLFLLLLLIWQPVIRVEQTKLQPGVVAVLVDLSNSMATPDLYSADDPLVDEATAVEMRKIASSRPDGRGGSTDPQLVNQVLRRMTGRNRIDLVRSTLEQDQRAVFKSLTAHNDLAIYTFSRTAARQVRLPQTPVDTQGKAKTQDGRSSNGTLALRVIACVLAAILVLGGILLFAMARKPLGGSILVGLGLALLLVGLLVFRPGQTRSQPVRPTVATTAPDSPDKQLNAAMDLLIVDHANGPATGVTQAISHVLNELRGQKVAGVIVLSDGRATLDSDPDGTVELANKWPVPIHTVTVGSIHPPRDLAVNRVLNEPIVFVKDFVAVKAQIAQHGYNQPEQVIVRLVKVAGTEEVELARQDVTVGEGATDSEGRPLPGQTKREVETELRFQPDVPGSYNLAVRVESVGGKSDLNPANNVGLSQVLVKEAKIKVLLIEGLPRWEYRFAVHSLLREKTITLSVMLLSADDTFAQEGSPGAAISRLPDTKQEWEAYDVIIMGDVNPFDLKATYLECLEAFVRDRGGGFAMIAGEQYSPQRYAGTPLAKLLPVEIDPNAGPDKINRTTGYKMRLTLDGKRSPILRFEKQPEKNEATIAAFPDFYWFKPVLALKPGAEVLAEHPVAMLGDSITPAPLLVGGRYGAGKTFFSAVDDTWRWRWLTGTQFFDTYWLQLVRYLSRNKLLDTDRRFELSTDQTEYDTGQRVRVLLQVLDRTITNLPDTIKVRVYDQAGNELEDMVLQRSGYVYEGDYVPLREGDWAFQLDKDDVESRFGIAPDPGGRELTMPRVQVHVAQSGQEIRDLSIDTKEFPRLAVRTNGRNISLAKLPELAESVPDLSRQINDDQDFRLWDNRLTLFVFALLITAEWILRKKNNLQ